MPNRYEEYLQIIKTNFTVATKIEWLNPDETVQYEITNRYVNMSGTISVGMENGTRRTCSMQFDNSDGYFSINPNSIWYGQKIKVWCGAYLGDGEPYYLPQGVFYITSISESNLPGSRTITMQCTDKWAFLDGTLYGNLDGIYLVPIGSNIYTAISTLLKTSRYTGKNVITNNEPIYNAIDTITPVLSSYYVNKTYVDGSTTYHAINTPYEVRIDYGGTYSSVLLEFAKILGCYIYYDVNGRLTIEPTQDDISDASKPILWTFTPTEQEFMSEESTHDFSTFYNDILVIGYVINGKQAMGRAQNTNQSSPSSIQRNGIKTYPPYQDTTYYTDQQCLELARYYLKRQTIKQRSVTITSSPMYHLAENRLVECIRPYTLEVEPLLVNGLSIPIGTSGSISITATSVNEFNFGG